ncbi:hypothetical protein [Sphingomonas colocasiae]|uniref:Uncharacterized protein n=1 Tax=Sphingomonas colocasiae TaxID=1848973 RepID=A0ABS7PS64_9SPHN|nr:hypothetical protein [Sphingomonas colocasiae]MBY8823232.1 hypothetical protein [Sphingomonas colocasiae]
MALAKAISRRHIEFIGGELILRAVPVDQPAGPILGEADQSHKRRILSNQTPSTSRPDKPDEMWMAGSSSGGGSAGTDPLVQQYSSVLAVVAIFGCWSAVQLQIPAESRFLFADLLAEHWAHRDALQPWLDERWAWLAGHGYHRWFALATMPGVVAVGSVNAFDKRSPWPILHALLGWGGGVLLGVMLFLDFRCHGWPLAVPVAT